jgi:beta-1,4-mannosyl-glycoprotein beta-1,4-N-acetylglucosaminyltransferase
MTFANKTQILDCFTYFNEDMLLNIRFNELDPYVDKFCIVECGYTHQGNKKKKFFDIKNFEKFRNKIEYLFVDKVPINIIESLALNKWAIERYQRNCLLDLIKKISQSLDDIVLISDLDEIPNLSDINLVNILKKKKIIIFQQKLFYYKFNYQNITRIIWEGTKACCVKNLKSPQEIRNLRNGPGNIAGNIIKAYLKKILPNYCFIVLNFLRKSCEKIKESFFNQMYIHKNGGWHFSFVMNDNDIRLKLMSYGHVEYNQEKFININNIKQKILTGEDILDKGHKFKKTHVDLLPNYIKKNLKYFKEFII